MTTRTGLFLLFAFFLSTASLRAATGSAETGDVTVDTRSNNADLSALTISSGTLATTFDAATKAYTASVGNETTSLTVTPTVADATATIAVRVNDDVFVPLTSGNASGSLALAVGDNTIDVEVTAQDTSTTMTYTVTVTRDKADQTITFDEIGKQFANATLTLAATGGGSSSGVTYEILDGPGEIANGNELSFTGGGSVTVRATQSGDDLYDAAPPVDQIFEVILPQPDVAVGRSPAALVGVDIYLPTGQLVSLTSKKARPVSGYVALANRVVLPDDRAMDQVALRGTGGNVLFKVTYLGPAGNVTAGVITGTFRTDAIDGDDASVVVRAAVTPNKKKLTKKKKRRKIYLRKTFTSLFQANSNVWPDANDSATIQVRTR